MLQGRVGENNVVLEERLGVKSGGVVAVLECRL